MIKKRHIPYHLDDPNATIHHREIILSTPFLKKIYLQWYKIFEDIYNQQPNGQYLELGSGGGFLKDILPNIITSDILNLPYVDKQIDAQHLPFDDNSLDGIFILNVFHHIPNPALFLKEAQRTLKTGGKVVMIEPANTLFSRLIYKKFHHEPFDEKGALQIEPGKPLSHSNQALPYIYFIREKKYFESNFPNLKITSIRYHTALLYLLSGGMSYHPLVPAFSFSFFRFIELLLYPVQKYTALFQTIIISKK
ncbi:MAG: class I SAM-dependent methyltransferase [Bacteroidetes bacterium]|nr:MAG: class I SAM-dependent methyltransferase [Bacteroidota bacterium]